MKAFILISVLISLAMADGVCPDWRCGQLDNGACMHWSNPISTVLIQDCGKGNGCPLPFNALQQSGPSLMINSLSNGNLTCTPYTPTPPTPVMDRAAGDQCRDNSFCHSGSCNQGICDPSSQIGGQCQSHKDCPIAAYCNPQSNFCANILAPKAVCTDMGFFFGSCGWGAFCFNSTCTPFFALPEGTVISTNGSYNYVDLCKTGFAFFQNNS